MRVQQAEEVLATALEADCAHLTAEGRREGRAEVVSLHEEDMVSDSIAEETVGACDLGWEWQDQEGRWHGWWTDRLTLSGVDAPWVEREDTADIWDAETAARAEEEMRLASAARSGLC